MNVLLIGMHFYEYEERIKQEIENQGHYCDLIYDSKRLQTGFDTEESFLKECYEYQKIIIQELTHNYDLILVLVGRYLSSNFLSELKEKNQDSKFVLYLWDDVHRVGNFEALKQFYNEIYSFDLTDCEKYNFKFLPLFYTDDFKYNNEQKKIDLYGAYQNHSDRMRIIKKLAKVYSEKNTYFFIKIGRKQIIQEIINEVFLRKTIKGIHYSTKNLPLKENAENMKTSFAVLDIQHPTQKGLTMRTIEALASRTKLITTNPEIKKYDFYNENNICIIDRESAQIPANFFIMPYSEDVPKKIEKYSLKNWISTLLG